MNLGTTGLVDADMPWYADLGANLVAITMVFMATHHDLFLRKVAVKKMALKTPPTLGMLPAISLWSRGLTKLEELGGWLTFMSVLRNWGAETWNQQLQSTGSSYPSYGPSTVPLNLQRDPIHWSSFRKAPQGYLQAANTFIYMIVMWLD